MILPRPMRKSYAASIAVLLSIAACLLAAPLIATAADRYDVERVGVPQIGARGVTRSTMDIMFEESMHNADSKGNPRLMTKARVMAPINSTSGVTLDRTGIPGQQAVVRGIARHRAL